MNDTVDIVVTWVDGSDPNWQRKREPYINDADKANDDIAGEKRYKDTGFFRYFFRGIEKFAPWVNRVYLVTDNQKPEWLNANNRKLVLINHEQIIDKKYLPIFNSNAILINLHKIHGLSDNFIYFNDDMFLIGPTKKTDFFKNGKPKDMAVLGIMSPSNNDMFWNLRANLISTINSRYSSNDVRKHFFKWINFHYPIKYNVRNISLMRYGYITDILNPHVPHSYCKNYFVKMWDYFPNNCELTMESKFRKKKDISEWIVRYCQLMEGYFSPANLDKMGRVFDANDEGVGNYIKSKHHKFICINNDADKSKYNEILESFEYLFPEKSSYEL